MSDTMGGVGVADVRLGRERARNANLESTYDDVVDEICHWHWRLLSRQELINVAYVYYYFSIQFRENLEIAIARMPDDPRLKELDRGERNTDNLSPWPGVALPGERMNHDEFMRRTLQLSPIEDNRRQRLEAIGKHYLQTVGSIDWGTRIMSLASYENGGLERVFASILQAEEWDNELLQAFKHFLIEHIKFDSDPQNGHGAICKHLDPDESVASLWVAFRDMLVAAAPKLVTP